jgi:hypothetical protein
VCNPPYTDGLHLVCTFIAQNHEACQAVLAEVGPRTPSEAQQCSKHSHRLRQPTTDKSAAATGSTIRLTKPVSNGTGYTSEPAARYLCSTVCGTSHQLPQFPKCHFHPSSTVQGETAQHHCNSTLPLPRVHRIDKSHTLARPCRNVNQLPDSLCWGQLGRKNENLAYCQTLCQWVCPEFL